MSKRVISGIVAMLILAAAVFGCKKANETTEAEASVTATETTENESTEVASSSTHSFIETGDPADFTIPEDDPTDEETTEQKGDEPTPPVSESETVPTTTISDEEMKDLTFEQFMALPVEQKQAHVHSYEDPEDWLKWYLAALAKYNDEHPANPIDGDIDLSGFLQ